MSDLTSQTEIALRQFTGQLIADALGWPNVISARSEIMPPLQPWQSPEGRVTLTLDGSPQWGCRFDARALGDTPGLIVVLRRQFDEAQQEDAR